MPPNATEVLIAGAGPSGLLLACDLVRRGVSFRIVDKLLIPSDKSRALIVQARTTEVFEQLGLVDELLASGRRIDGSRFFVDGREQVRLDFGSLKIEGAPYAFLLNVAQDQTERILTEQLAREGHAVERGVELVSFEQDASGVRSRLRLRDGSEETVKSRFIVGCDGAHSVVRHGLGIAFNGAPYEQDFVLADVDMDDDIPRDEFRIFVSNDGVFAVFPMKGEKRVRLLASRRGVRADAGDPTLPEFQELVERFLSTPARLANPFWLARFRLHHRLADRYSSGRAFLCGDAAHIHSPAGGQGMNTGLQDAWNLGWKLALVLQGRARQELLESYHLERHPVGEFLMQSTDRLFQMATSGGAVLSFVRRHIAPTLAKAVLHREGVRRFALSTIGQLGIQYRKSPIVREGSPRLHEGLAAGDRAPDAGLLDSDGKPTRLFLQLRGLRHKLLLFGGSAAPQSDEVQQQLAARFPGLVDVHRIFRSESAVAAGLADAGIAHERYGVTEPAQYLIRPDGYIAWRAKGWSAEGLVQFLGESFG